MAAYADGAAAAPLAKTVSGRQYKFAANDNQLEMMGIECGEGSDEATLVMRHDGREQRVVCGHGRWVKGDLAVGRFAQQSVAVCGVWTADDTYTVRICICETPHILTLRLKFVGDELVLDAEMNVDFRPTKQPQLTGRA